MDLRNLVDKKPLVVDRFQSTPYRITGIAFGIATQLLFLWTVVQLFQFLRYGGSTTRDFSPVIDIGLAALFVVPHSILLLPPVQKLLRKLVPSGWLGCIHCNVSCLTLLVIFECWTGSQIVLWNFQHATLGEEFMLAGFYGSWAALLYSLYLTGLGYQTGLTQWWYWLRNVRPPVRAFKIDGIYKYLRHPVYLSFLGLIWFTPRMSLDHLILTGLWTVYIYVGSMLKDQRLLHYIGEPYREYAARVPGYPGVTIGPLAKWSPRNPNVDCQVDSNF